MLSSSSFDYRDDEWTSALARSKKNACSSVRLPGLEEYVATVANGFVPSSMAKGIFLVSSLVKTGHGYRERIRTGSMTQPARNRGLFQPAGGQVSVGYTLAV